MKRDQQKNCDANPLSKKIRVNNFLLLHHLLKGFFYSSPFWNLLQILTWTIFLCPNLTVFCFTPLKSRRARMIRKPKPTLSISRTSISPPSKKTSKPTRVFCSPSHKYLRSTRTVLSTTCVNKQPSVLVSRFNSRLVDYLLMAGGEESLLWHACSCWLQLWANCECSRSFSGSADRPDCPQATPTLIRTVRKYTQ